MNENESRTVQNPSVPGSSLPPSAPIPKGPRLGVVISVIVLMALAFVIGVIASTSLKSFLAGSSQAEAGKAQYYTCGMHPWVVLPRPGNCPICQMKLVPLDPAKFTSEIVINPAMTQSIGIRLSPVASGPLTRVMRTVGAVDYNETLVRDVNIKVSGWVEKLYVNSVGQPVEKDQPLLDIYSPDLYSAQVEYLLALKGKDVLKSTPPATGDDLLAAARKRLEYYDISQAQIEELEKSGKVSKTMALRSPFRGTVVIKNVLEGQKVDAGMQLLRIADFSKVWVMVTVYEYQVPFVEVGQKAVMTLPYIPGQAFEGKVTYIYPYLNPESRQAKVRLEFDNPNQLLKPGMYANVELRSTLATDRTLVPREAVIDTGTRQVAFVSLGEGRFQPREVQIGVEADGGMLEILDGLKPGEMVVTSGEFLLDSEARLHEALAKMIQGAPATAQQAQTLGVSELAQLPEKASTALAAILDGYMAIGAKLADDSIDGLAASAGQAAENTDALIHVPLTEAPQFWQKHTEAAQVRGKALELADAKDLATARQEFADMGVALAKLLRATGVPPTYGKEVQQLHCPMYREKQGGTIWLQTAGDVRNPYYGKVMLNCFDARFSLPVTGAKPPAPVQGMPPGMTGM